MKLLHVLALILFSVLSLASSYAQIERVPSFGPNGTHWPSLISTPFMYDESVPNRIVVDADWRDIGDAIESVTAAQANEGVLILVRPGTIAGNGNGGGSAAVLKDIGSTGWSKRITVAPLDGYGTVKLTNGVRILRVKRVCFAGFDIVNGIKLEGCQQSAIAWCKVTSWFAVYGNSLVTTDLMEIVEVVQPNHYVSNSDSSDFFTNGGDMTGWRFDGCYHAPRFFHFPYTGGKPHTDTFQFAGSGGGSYGNMTIRDGAYFSSNNCSIQTGSLVGLDVEHSYVVSGSVSLSRYPHLSGGATEATVNAFNGAGQNFTAKDSIFIGGMAINSAGVWKNVENTKTDRAYSSALNPGNGSWTVDELLKTDLSTMPPYPTDDYLKQIWSGDGVVVIPPPVIDEPADTTGRYVRIQLPGASSILSLSEVLVLGSAVDGGYDNLSLGQTTSQSSTGSNGVSSRAVDGNVSGVWRNGTTTHTTESNQPWWQVDLGSDNEIELIEIWNRTDGALGERLSDFSVFVSDQDMSGSSFEELQADSSVWSYTFSGIPDERTLVPVGINGAIPRSTTPSISPSPGVYLVDQLITITSEDDGAELFYTVDGSDPESSATSIKYSAPFALAASATVRVSARSEGNQYSLVEDAEYVLTANGESDDFWTNINFPPQTETFTINWDSVPSGNNIDSLSGISLASADNFTDLACIVRFAPSGRIDVRDGAAYRADQEMVYEEGKTYGFFLTVDVVQKTYQVVVKLPEGNLVELATDYSFRTDQAGVAELSNFAFLTVGEGSHTIEELRVNDVNVIEPPQNIKVSF